MKTRTLALCATAALATASSVRAETRNDAVILCTVRLESPSGDGYLSISIPDSVATGTEVGSMKLWNLGTVAVGGVYDSFYNGGPGYFRVQNTGTLPAYVYVSTGSECHIERGGNEWMADDVSFSDTAETYVADHPWNGRMSFNPWIQGWYEVGYDAKLAVSTDVTGIVPNWRPLSYFYHTSSGIDNAVDGWYDGSKCIYQDANGILSYGGKWVYFNCNEVSAFLAFMPVGETQLFDLKFWAPYREYEDGYFVVCVHASAVRLWDHE